MSRELIMVYDTETSDKWDFKSPWNAPHQPNLCQLGLKVYTDNKEVVFEAGINVNTTAFVTWNGINPDAQNVHGISEDLLRNYGDTPEYAADTFMKWVSMSHRVVAHNEDFDNRIMQCFLFRAGYNPDFCEGGIVDRFCTMKSTTSICRIPSPRGFGHKWPSLKEAYEKLIDSRGFKNAHNALADVNPCADIFWYLKDKGLVNNAVGA